MLTDYIMNSIKNINTPKVNANTPYGVIGKPFTVGVYFYIMKEVWKDIEGYEGYYQISNYGNVKSVDRFILRSIDTNKTHIKERILKPGKDGNYKYVFLCIKCNRRIFRIHRLVANAFIPKIKGKEHVNHINGIKTDNNVNNLEWCTNDENRKHAGKIGLMQRGGEHYNSKLNEADIPIIVKLYNKGMTQGEIGAKYNVHKSTIGDIIIGRQWGHVKTDKPRQSKYNSSKNN